MKTLDITRIAETVFAAISILFLGLAGCDSSPTDLEIDRHSEPLAVNPPLISVNENTVYIAAHEGETTITLTNESRNPLVWGENLSLVITSHLLELDTMTGFVVPGGSIDITVYASRLEAGLELPSPNGWIGRFMQVPDFLAEDVIVFLDGKEAVIVEVVVQMGFPHAKPIGVPYSFIRFKPEMSVAGLPLFNSSNDRSWGSSMPDMRMDIPWVKGVGAQTYVLEPGRIGGGWIEVDRTDLAPGRYRGVIELLSLNRTVQTVVLELVVE